MFKIFGQVRIGEIGKKDYKNAKRIKKNKLKTMEFMKNFGFQISIFFLKTFHDFPKFFDKISNAEKKILELFDNYRQTKLKIKCQK